MSPVKQPDRWAGQQGTRASHVCLVDGGGDISKLDFVGHGCFVLSKNPEWSPIVKATILTVRPGIKLDFVLVEGEVKLTGNARTFAKAFGLGMRMRCLCRQTGTSLGEVPRWALMPSPLWSRSLISPRNL